MEFKRCPDCGAKPGQMHKAKCDWERCPICGGQLLSCHCDRKKYVLRKPFNGEDITETPPQTLAKKKIRYIFPKRKLSR